jgi:hypothetical protein
LDIRINAEIRDIKESVFFGLTLRQTVLSVLGCLQAAAARFLLIDSLGAELTSWVCVIAAVPPLLMAFASYNGMNAEKTAAAWIKSTALSRRLLVFPRRDYAGMLLDPEYGTTAACRMGEFTVRGKGDISKLESKT